MKESMWGYWLILLGIGIISVMILLQNYTTTNQQDYYLAKEITYAAMYDAIDYGYYKKNGELKIIKEKFIENFLRRFAESVTLNKKYTINFYTIYEEPPFASVEIVAKTGEYRIGTESLNSSITTRISALLELSSGSSSEVVNEIVIPDEEPVVPEIKPVVPDPIITPQGGEIKVESDYFYAMPYSTGYRDLIIFHGSEDDIREFNLKVGKLNNHKVQMEKLKKSVESTGAIFDESKVKVELSSYEMFDDIKSYDEYISKQLCVIGVDGIDPCDGSYAYSINDQLDFNFSQSPDASVCDDIGCYHTFVGYGPLRSVPNSLLYYIKTNYPSQFKCIFAGYRNGMSIKFDITHNGNINDLNAKLSIRWGDILENKEYNSGCEDTNFSDFYIGNSGGLVRKKYKEFNTWSSSEQTAYNNLTVSQKKASGIFTMYDYYYRPSASVMCGASVTSTCEMTPYVGTQLIGVKFKLNYTYQL